VSAAARRSHDFTLLQNFSIGFRPGEDAGRYHTLAPAASVASSTPPASCAARLSITTTPPGSTDGAGQRSTHRANVAPFIGPSKSAAMKPPNREPMIRDTAFDEFNRAFPRTHRWPFQFGRLITGFGVLLMIGRLVGIVSMPWVIILLGTLGGFLLWVVGSVWFWMATSRSTR
jgi:hypothetical protein